MLPGKLHPEIAKDDPRVLQIESEEWQLQWEAVGISVAAFGAKYHYIQPHLGYFAGAYYRRRDKQFKKCPALQNLTHEFSDFLVREFAQLPENILSESEIGLLYHRSGGWMMEVWFENPDNSEKDWRNSAMLGGYLWGWFFPWFANGNYKKKIQVVRKG